MDSFALLLVGPVSWFAWLESCSDKLLCRRAALVTRGLSRWDQPFSPPRHSYAGIRPTTTAGGIANRAMRSRIVANKFRVTATSASWNGIDPFRYLADVLRRLPTTPPDRPTELLPEVWFQVYL